MYNITMSLRMTEETYEKIKEIAEKEKRSINGQINLVLEKFIEEYEEKENNK